MRRTKIGKFELGNKFSKHFSNPIVLGLSVIVLLFLFVGLFKGASFIGAAVTDMVDGKNDLLLQAAAYCPSGFYLPYNDDSGTQVGQSCCGNAVCEGAEEVNNCPYDCQKTKTKVFSLDEFASKLEGKQIPTEYFSKFKPLLGGTNQDFSFKVKMEDGTFVTYKIKVSEEGNVTSVQRVSG